MCVNPKYNIKRRMLDLPGSFRNAKYELAIATDAADRTIDNWISVEKGAKYSIPSDQLILIAKFFNCTITDLIN